MPQITDATPPPAPEPEPEPVDEQETTPPQTVQLPNLTPDLGPPSAAQTVFFNLPDAESAPEVKNKDLYCSGFIRPSAVSTDLRVAAKVTSASTDGLYAALGEYVYLSQGIGRRCFAGRHFYCRSSDT